jgi:hypothetical protein
MPSVSKSSRRVYDDNFKAAVDINYLKKLKEIQPAVRRSIAKEICGLRLLRRSSLLSVNRSASQAGIFCRR